MTEKNTYNEFDKKIQEKLQHHGLPVDADIWKGIESKLKPAPKRTIPFWYWISSASAVAVILLLVGFFNTINNDLAYELDTKKNTSIIKSIQNKTLPKVVAEKLTNKPIAFNGNKKVKNVSSKNKGVKIENIVLKADSTQIAQPIKAEITNNTKNEFGLNDLITSNDNNVQNKLNSGEHLTNKTTKNKENIIHENEPDWTDEFKKEPESEWVLVASIGSSGSGSTSGSNLESNTNLYKSSIMKAPTKNTTILSPSDFSDRNYSAPITFGINASKKISKHLSLETGINYTNLFTALKRNNATADFSLHYVGVPLNLMYHILKNNKFGIYTSAGVMAEKGIWSVYRQDEYVGNQTITTTVTKKIDGLQWSASGAIGATYAIVDMFDIYFEPKLSVFLNNNQPLSIRTENKYVIGFAGGIRWNL